MSKLEVDKCYYGEFSGKTIYILQESPHIIMLSREKTYSVSRSDWEKLYYKYIEISKEQCIKNFLGE